MTTGPPRGARARRAGHRPGWVLLTALLVMAIAASSVLVFTNRVELLKLAVIVSLWAAVVAAFASVLYRRQSDVDRARAHDLKLVYDLQLDREISARRDYELTVESQLRRELAAELRDQAADEVAALRAELSALRANLEVLFEADLATRPALEAERTTVHAYSDWAREPDGAPVARVVPDRADRVGVLHSEDIADEAVENPIIDVPEVGVPAAAPAAAGYPGPHSATGQGSHHRMADDRAQRYPNRRMRAEPEPPRQPESWSRPRAPEPARPAAHWRPVRADGEWLPPGTPGTHWTSESSADQSAFSEPARRSRHRRPAGPAESAPPYEGRRRADGRSPTPQSAGHLGTAPSAPRHREQEAGLHREQEAGLHSAESAAGAEPVADLLARLQAGSSGGRRRRRRRAADDGGTGPG